MFQVNEVNPQSIEFGLEDFRAYNDSGFEEVKTALELARGRFETANTLVEREMCQMRLDSLERLWRLSLQLAHERFDHARDAATTRLNEVIELLRRSQLQSRERNKLWEQARIAAGVFAQKKFSQAIELADAIEAASMRPARRRLGIALPDGSLPLDGPHNVSGNAVDAGPVLVPQADGDLTGLLESALEFERHGRNADACRFYLKVLERQPGNAGARQDVEMATIRQL